MLASHPQTEKRIRHIREASTQANVSVNPRLKAIFEKLKK
jgi:hypothetical protein